MNQFIASSSFPVEGICLPYQEKMGGKAGSENPIVDPRVRLFEIETLIISGLIFKRSTARAFAVPFTGIEPKDMTGDNVLCKRLSV